MTSEKYDGAPDEGMSRRVFLQGVGAAALVCPLLAACEFVEVYGDSDLEETAFDINEEAFAALAEVGGTACLMAGSADLLLIRRSADQVLAVDRLCPHQGQNMGPCDNNFAVATWDAEEEQLTCVWHGSVFDVEGQVVEGPSPRPLGVYPTEFDPETGVGRVLGAESNQGEG